MKHMPVIETICKEVSYGFGRRYIVIRDDLMYDAPDSLLDITTEMSGRDILNSDDPGLNFKELGKRQKMLEENTYRVFAFKDSEERMEFKKAVKFAEKNGMRLLTVDEVDWFHSMLNKLPQWDHTLVRDHYYWSGYESSRWLAYYDHRCSLKKTETEGLTSFVRCISKI